VTSHLTLPYNWVNCTDPETCAEHIHLEDAAEALNSYPKQWVEELIGNCVITRHTNPTAIVETITTRDNNGELHSNTIPAIIQNRCHRSGNLDHSVEEWYQHGKRHRINGPAHQDSNGNAAWYVNGQYHRENGPALEYTQGKKIWYVNGQLHRTDGPAVIFADGKQEWWFKNRLHRVDGPAVIHADGTTVWWMNGTKLTEPPPTTNDTIKE
jgi:hypothetical protein